MLIVRSVLLLVINLYTLVLWARFVLDWVMVLNPRWRPRGFLLVLCDAVFRLTDPPLRFVRRYLKPVRIGSIALDLAWIVVMLALVVLSYLVQVWIRF